MLGPAACRLALEMPRHHGSPICSPQLQHAGYWPKPRQWVPGAEFHRGASKHQDKPWEEWQEPQARG